MAEEDSVIFEFTRVGAFSKVTAIHMRTGTEAMVMGPAASSRSALQGLALRKLEYVLNRREQR